LDRLELIEVPSYTELEKIKIADGFLVKKQMTANGLKEGDVSFPEDGIKEIIEFYTREAGVRELERLIASCCRKAVVELIKAPQTQAKPIVMNAEQVKKYLGVEIFEDTEEGEEAADRRRHRLGLHRIRRRHPADRSHLLPGQRRAGPDGQARRCHEGKRTIAVDYVRANAKPNTASTDKLLREERHPHPLPRGRRAQRRAERRRGDHHRHHLLPDPYAGGQ
jgi:ATP-dependent Lon protease